MEEKNKYFLKQLDELIFLFEKLRLKATQEGVILKDDPMYKNFELLSGNYKLIKNNIPPELLEEIGEPIKLMITEMVAQLKMDLGLDSNDFDANNALITELNDVDLMLKNQNLSETEINDLLDKRSRLKKD